MGEARKSGTAEILSGKGYRMTIGQLWKTTDGTVELVGRGPKLANSNHRPWEVRFLRTGQVRLAHASDIRRGHVSDPKARNVFGVGYKDGRVSPRGCKVYRVWSAMLKRCYDRSGPDYVRYGARGVRVCPRWHSLANFAADIQELEGYGLWVSGRGQLDKDKLGDGLLYSPETCCFVTHAENTQLARNRAVVHLATGLTYRSAVEAAKAFGCSRATVGLHCRNLVQNPEWRYERTSSNDSDYRKRFHA